MPLYSRTKRFFWKDLSHAKKILESHFVSITLRTRNKANFFVFRNFNSIQPLFQDELLQISNYAQCYFLIIICFFLLCKWDLAIWRFNSPHLSLSIFDLTIRGDPGATRRRHAKEEVKYLLINWFDIDSNQFNLKLISKTRLCNH